MKFFTKEASKALRTERGAAEWDRRWARYELHLRKIRPLLSESWWRVAKADFHDTNVFSFTKLANGEFVFNIDMNPRWKQPPVAICSLRFQGVRKIDVPEKVVKNWLIYTEVHARRGGGAEWRGICANYDEFQIVADEVCYSLNYDPAWFWRES
jgi:hypothetical protein